MILNEFMIKLVHNDLISYAHNYIKKNYPEEDFDEELNKYMECDYEYHLHYLIETWKKKAEDNALGNIKIDYNTQGNFKQISDFLIFNMPLFDYTWLSDIFERDILHTNIILK